MVHHGHHHHHFHNHDFEPNFKFHYPTYEIPVHGDVVSDKDAKKIGKDIFFHYIWRSLLFDAITDEKLDNFYFYKPQIPLTRTLLTKLSHTNPLQRILFAFQDYLIKPI